MFGLTKQSKTINEINKRHRHKKQQVTILDVLGKEVEIKNKTLKEAAMTLCQFLITMNTQLNLQSHLLTDALDAHEQDLVSMKTCFETAADCQKQTSDLANQCLQRHALHPSILAIDMLTKSINQIAQQAGDLMKNHQLDESFTPLAHSIIDTAKIAKSKKLQLQIQDIRPSKLDDLDSDRHKIVKAVDTDDSSRHKKIHETLTVGLFYHGKVLRQARVSVYRFSGNGTAEQKNSQPKCQIKKKGVKNEKEKS